MEKCYILWNPTAMQWVAVNGLTHSIWLARRFPDSRSAALAAHGAEEVCEWEGE